MKLILLGLAWAFLHHLIAGVRYLLLDLHIGVDKPAARTSALAVFCDQPAADSAGGAEDLRSVLMAASPTPQAIGSKRIVVGAHYGVGGFLLQRLTAVMLTAFVLFLPLRLRRSVARSATTAGPGSLCRSG